MDLRQLRYFTAVVDEGGMRKAALAVHVSQPSLSTAIQNLEAELSVSLFARTGRTVQPTAEGYHFYKRARALLAQAEKTKAEMLSFRALEKAEIRVAAPITIASYVLADPIGNFLKAYPGVKLSLKQMSGHEVESALLVGDIDIGVLSRQPRSAEIAAHAVHTRRICAYVREGHLLAEKKTITWSELLDHPIASLPQKYVLHDIMNTHASRSKKTADLIVESDVVPLLAATARQSDAVCLLLEDVARKEPGLIQLDIADDSKGEGNQKTTIDITVCHLKDSPLSLGAEAMFEYFRNIGS